MSENGHKTPERCQTSFLAIYDNGEYYFNPDED